MFKFRLLAQDPDTGARAGEFETPHGVVPTPAFMPCATQGTVKGLTPVHLEEIGAQMLLANAYHLSLRPGAELIARMGGIHRFMNWEKPILTDSGGFQVFSMSAPRTARKGARIRARPASRRSGGQVAQRAGSPVAAEEMFHEDSREGNGRESSSRQSSLPVIHAPVVSEGGVLFKSHLDGREIFLTPERCVETENRIGADVIMPLDECAPFPCEKAYARAAMERTLGWAVRCKAAHRREDQALFGIVQGAAYPELRRECADRIAALDFPGHAIGGLSVGEGDGLMEEMTARALERLPSGKPRYLMGVGRPQEILTAVGQGIDLFDCVLPTRCGRNGLAFTTRGRVKVRNAAQRTDARPLDPECDCLACRKFSRAYLCHLFNAGEMLGLTLLTLHNLRHYARLMAGMRRAILEGRFREFRREFQSAQAAQNVEG